MTNQLDRIDPESRIALEAQREALPGGSYAIRDIVERRAVLAARKAEAVAAAGGPDPSVTRDDRRVPGLDGDPEVELRVYRPVGVDGVLPGVLYIHGGGMIGGSIEDSDGSVAALARELGAVVVSAGYRKAPEDPHPAQSRDVYACLQWMTSHADEIGFDPERFAIYGGSAGGTLALSAAIRLRDEGLPAPLLVMAAYPMLDHTHTTPSSHAVTDLGAWDRRANIEAWEWFLAGQEPDKFASPILETDWSGIGPLFIDVGTEDAFRDEDIAFVAELVKQGVFVEFHLYPGAYHASEGFAPEAALSKRILATRLDALRRALASR